MNLGKLSDQWQTPMWLFDELDNRFNFNIDLCATDFNRKKDHHLSDFLDDDPILLNPVGIQGRLSSFDFIKCGFINPPYSDLYPFVSRAFDISKKMLVVSLLKADASTKWWGIFWDYQTQQPKAGCRIEYPSQKGKNQGRRVKFDPPPKHILEKYLEHGTEKDKKLATSLLEGKITTPAFPSAIVIFDRRHLTD